MEQNNALYQITNQFVVLMNKYQEGELTEEETAIIAQELETELVNKSGNIIGFVKNVEAHINAIKAEEERLADMRKSAQKKLDKFKGYVKENMDRLGFKKIETTIGDLSIRNCPVSVEITNEEEVPMEFKTTEFVTKVDKKAIIANFKSTGEIPEGCNIIADKTTLNIK